jgi:TPR repeat protein
MLRSLTKRGWRDHIASLGRRADAGEVSAMTDLGLNLFEGIQDRKGRSIVRRNPRAAVAWFLRAANRGDRTAASSLGYACDVGLGTKRNVAQAIRWYRRAARSKRGSHFNGGSERPTCVMATPLSMLATAINTALAQERTSRMRSACSDARSRPETLPKLAAKKRCITSPFSSSMKESGN